LTKILRFIVTVLQLFEYINFIFQMLYALFQKPYLKVKGVFVVYIPAALAYYGAAGWHIPQGHRARAYFRIMADCDGAKHSRARAYHHIIAYGWVPLANILAGAAQGNALIDNHIVPYFACLAYYDACTVVYKNALADDCTGVNFYARQKARDLRNQPRQQKKAVAVHPMGHAMKDDGPNALI